MADEETPDPGRDFAALMSQAAQAAAPDVGEAPYGWTTDPVTGERRPKKTAGRPRKPPPIEELKAAKAAEDPGDGGAVPPGDRAPSPGKRKKATPTGDAAVPQHRPGLITKGMNKRYRQIGKLIRGLDHDIGQALIVMAENTSDEPDEDTSVGACWDEVARVNPRVRKFCLSVIQGGAYGALVMAHSPLGVAIALKFVSADPGFFGKIIISMAEPDEDTPEGEGGLPFGLTAADAAQMMQMAGPLLEQMGAANGTPPPSEPPGPPPQRRPPAQFARHGQGKRR
jgi:hypothetical protein